MGKTYDGIDERMAAWIHDGEGDSDTQALRDRVKGRAVHCGIGGGDLDVFEAATGPEHPP